MKYLLIIYLLILISIPITYNAFPMYSKIALFSSYIIALVKLIVVIFFTKDKKKTTLQNDNDAPLDPAYKGIKFDNDFKKVPAGDDKSPND